MILGANTSLKCAERGGKDLLRAQKRGQKQAMEVLDILQRAAD